MAKPARAGAVLMDQLILVKEVGYAVEEERLRVEVATCCRLLEYLGLIDFSGHVSARIPGTDAILINSWGRSRCKVEPQDIVKANLAGESLVEGARVPSEIHIHTAIYRRRQEVGAVAHLHPPATIALSVAGKEYLPVIYHGAIFAEGVPVFDDCRHVNSRERGEALATTLGQARAAIMRGHGAVVVAETLKGVFFASVYLEDNARKLLDAYRIGEPRRLREEELEEGKGLWREQQFEKVWTYYQEKANIRLA